MRSGWKNKCLLVYNTLLGDKVVALNSKISKEFLGLQIEIYNGYSYFSFLVKEEHLNFRYGEFCFTTSLGVGIHKEDHIRPRRNKRMNRKKKRKKGIYK